VKVKQREKIFLIVGTAVVAAVVIFYAMTSLLPDSDGLARTVELKKRMLLKHRETLGLEETYKKRVAQYSKHLEQDMQLLLPGDNPSVAGAELQKTLKDFADRSGVELTQKNTLQEKKTLDMLTKVSVRIETKCEPKQLTDFLMAIHNYEKFLKIEEFTLTSWRIQKKYEIRPILTVVGYIRTPESKPKEKPAGG
jgi:hypothetical protein